MSFPRKRESSVSICSWIPAFAGMTEGTGIAMKQNYLYLKITIFAIFSSTIAQAQSRVSDTTHNLSVSGPGQIRAGSEQEVCIFCHAPHNTSGKSPLWNRELRATNYDIYQSSTLDAQPGQPTGSSKLCLSCHDGTIALGNVLSRADKISMLGGDYMPAGLSHLGTNLSDDHPISFYYTTGLAASDSQLLNPQSLPPAIKLDATGQLQCTACHDPHNNTYGKFMVTSNEYGVLCTGCHNMNGWNSGSHQSSSASVAGATIGDWPYMTVTQNACRSCHKSHTAGGKERLLIFANEEDNCLGCHDGLVASSDITSEISKLHSHDPRDYSAIHDPAEAGSPAQDHVECADCHNPHAAANQPTVSGYIPIGATLSKVPGVTIGGGYTQEAQREYEVCFRCHSDNAVQISDRITRLSHTDSIRLKFSPTSISFHPLAAPSPGSGTVSLIPSLISGGLIRCTDCHNSNTSRQAGGSGPDGPHGSIYNFLLERNYTTSDNVNESAFEYALCYKCHERQSILSNESFSEHNLHIS